MALYLISYDLVGKPESSYVQLTNQLRAWNARKVLQSQWLLINEAAPLAIVNALIKLAPSPDRLLVTEITKRSAWRNTLLTDADLRAWFAYARD